MTRKLTLITIASVQEIRIIFCLILIEFFFSCFFCDFFKLYLHCIMYRKNEEEREWMKRARKGGNRKKKVT